MHAAQAIKENLKEQGVPVVKVSLYGYVEDLSGGGGGGASGLMTSASSPKRKSNGASPSPEPAGRDGAAELEPEQAAVAYKQRMAQSNVSFA